MLDRIFGSKIDWISQHSVFPEYFRQLFYDTGQIFPEYAANIGGGQNIYHFAYYGLYHPLFLPAYLFPNIKMSDYILFISILCLFVDGILFCHWVRSRGVSKGNSYLVSMMFLLAGPMIFHSYTHIMFVNYMPFLLLALLGVDRYFEKGKSCLFAMSVCLMIYSSFYFSIGGILVLVLYGIDRYLETKEKEGIKITWRSFLMEGVQFCMPILCGVLLSGILLVPTAMALLSNARGNENRVGILQLLLPNVSWMRMTYSSYAIGLSSIMITVLLSGILYKKWREKFLPLACLIVLSVPLFLYILNGGLYLREKALIPMLPLLCYVVAMYLEKLRKHAIPFWRGIIPYIVTCFLVLLEWKTISEKEKWFLLLVDTMMMLFAIGLYYRKGLEKGIILFSIFLLLISDVTYTVHKNTLLNRTFYERVTNKKIGKEIEKILLNEEGYYRLEQFGTREENKANINRVWNMDQYISSIYSSTYHSGYEQFRRKTFHVEQPYRNCLMHGSSQNAVFQKLMGLKYIVSDVPVAGYEKKKEGIYERRDVLPIAYVTNQVIKETDYETLSFPYNQSIFMDYAVVEKDVWNVAIEKNEEPWEHLKRQVKKVPEDHENHSGILFLRFLVENQNKGKDVSVTVNGIENKLSANTHIYYNENDQFTYGIPFSNEKVSLDIRKGKGNYKMQKEEQYFWTPSKKTSQLCQSPFQVDREKTKGNHIVGHVDVKEKGYFITSVPYEKHYTIQVDGKEVEAMKVNSAFLGFPIEEGVHKVEMIYHAPGLQKGKMMTWIGVLLYAILLFYSREKCYNRQVMNKERIGE